jgi:hypothetical protein
MASGRTLTVLTGAAVLTAAAVLNPAAAAAPPPTGGTVNGFAFGELQTQTVGANGCGTNTAGEPSLHVSKANLVGLGSEEGVGSGSEFWRVTQVGGTSGASACAPVYSGSPNGVQHTGASGGDIDTAFAPAKNAQGNYRIYVASLNLGSINVSVSNDNGTTFGTQTPVQGGIPIDDREWIAAWGASTSLLTYHDIATDNIDVLRSDNGGTLYTQIATAIPPTDYKAENNELGNLVIDHNRSTAAGFWAYQSFVAPSTDPGATLNPTFNEAFLAVSSDGGHTWTDKPIPCSRSFGAKGLAHNFPNVSVAPDGTLYYAVSNDSAIHVMRSTDHGNTWTCSGAVSSARQAIFPWLAATGGGVDLVYYGVVGTGSSQTWYVYFAQNTASSLGSWTTKRLMPVHRGAVCEGGVSCTGGRQLFDDFAVDTDRSGWAHIAYSHDAPNLGGSGSFTGYAVQRSGTHVGVPN